MIVIHGENTAHSRKKLQELITQAKTDNTSITRLEAKRLTSASLQEAMGGNSLFGDDKLIIIEELHSLPASKRKKGLIEQIGNSGLDNLVLYEKRKLTATMLKKIGNPQVFEFKISNTLWKFLDQIGGSDKTKVIRLLRESITQNDEFFVYTMIIRQIRMLITAKDGGVLKGAPFMITKLQGQARNVSIEQLLTTHKQLSNIDIKQKNSQLALSLSQELDLILLRM
jgi:DNA polymerase III delta subunit